MITFIGYMGAAFMVAFSFTLIPAIGIFGLALLTLQAVENKCWNLVGLNILSIVGLTLQMVG